MLTLSRHLHTHNHNLGLCSNRDRVLDSIAATHSTHGVSNMRATVFEPLKQAHTLADFCSSYDTSRPDHIPMHPRPHPHTCRSSSLQQHISLTRAALPKRIRIRVHMLHGSSASLSLPSSFSLLSSAPRCLLFSLLSLSLVSPPSPRLSVSHLPTMHPNLRLFA